MARKPKPDSAEWWRQVAQGLAIKLFDANQKLAALTAACADCERARPFADLCSRHFSEAMGDDARVCKYGHVHATPEGAGACEHAENVLGEPR